MDVRRARPAEAARLTALALRSKAHWGYDSEFLRTCLPELTVSAGYLAQHPTYVLERAEELIGFYTLEPTLEDARWELALLFVDPHAIGAGHGRALLQHAQRNARERGASALVIQSDPHAIGFYEACGARRIGERASASIPGRSLPVFELAL